MGMDYFSINGFSRSWIRHRTAETASTSASPITGSPHSSQNIAPGEIGAPQFSEKLNSVIRNYLSLTPAIITTGQKESFIKGLSEN
jgi:hypothetical protein